MSEQRLSLLIAGGGILCLLLQLTVSLTYNPVKRAQIASHEVTYKSVRLRAEKRMNRLAARLNGPLYEQNQSRMQGELDLAVQADPEIVEVGVVENDDKLSVWASSDNGRVGKELAGPAEEVVKKSVGAGRIPLITDPRQDQRVILVHPLEGQMGTKRTMYMEVTTAGIEDDISQVVQALNPPRVPAWLTIGLGLCGLGAALFMLFISERKQREEGMHLQQVVEQMAMGHFETRIDPVDVPHLAGVAERLNSMAEQVQGLQEQQAADSEYATRLEQDVQNAQVVQQMLVPEVKRIARGPLQLCGSYRSASKGSVSGDWWNHFPLDEHRTLLVLSDVVGHGIGAAVVGAMTYGCAQQLHQDLSSNLRPEALLDRLNQAILGTTKGKFTMSCFAVIVDTKENKLTFASAAHAFPLLFRPKDSHKPFIPLVATGSPLGSAKDSKFEANTQAFEPGDMIICYTDGLTEAANPNGDQFSDKRVRQTVQKHQTHNVQEICEALFNEMVRFVGKVELDDDITLVVARHAPSSADRTG